MPINIQSVNYCSVVRFGVFLGWDVGNQWSGTRCRLKLLRHVRESSSLTHGWTMWVSIEDNHIKRRRFLFMYYGAEEFFLTAQDKGGADQTNCLCPYGPTMFSNSRTSSPMSQTDPWLSPPPPQAPQLEPTAVVSCVICWWVHSQPL